MVGRILRYFHLDVIGEAIGGYIPYRIDATICFFRGPRLGHDWDGYGGHWYCKNQCGKTKDAFY